MKWPNSVPGWCPSVSAFLKTDLDFRTHLRHCQGPVCQRSLTHSLGSDLTSSNTAPKVDKRMCRLFGFRSVIPSQVHRSLLQADNALGLQSKDHPDGWGVAHYIDTAPHVIRSSQTAISDNLFHRVSGVVASETVLAHVRKATQGVKSVLNCHPFQYGRWVFAHNGDISNFETCREKLVQLISPHLRRFILGDTDSEVIFHLFLSELTRHGPLGRPLGPTIIVLVPLRGCCVF